MKVKNIFTSLVLLGTVLAPGLALANNSENSSDGMRDLKINFMVNAREDENKLKNLFNNETKTANVYVAGTVTSENGALLHLVASNRKEYTIDATNATITRSSGATVGLADIMVNDRLYVRGTLVGTTITATTIRDTSINVRSANFYGTVQSLNDNNNSFTLQTVKNGNKTIFYSSTTTIKTNGLVQSESALANGQYVYVSGSWNSRTNVISPTKVIDVIHRYNAIFLEGVVTAKSGSVITLKRGNGTLYNINIDRATIVSRFYNQLSINDVAVGETIQVGGIHLNDSTDVNAFIVHDNANLMNNY